MNQHGKDDIQMWQEWRRNPTPQNLGGLLKQTESARHRALQPWRGVVAAPTLNSEAIRLSVKAFKTFDPKKGVKLTTHLTNNLQKVSRMVYEESSLLRMPENRQMQKTTYRQAFTDLEERLGRDPSPEELSDELAWPLAEVLRFQQEDRKILTASEPLPVDMEPFSRHVGTNPNSKVHYLLADMDPVDQLIFRHSTGYDGAKILSGKELMRKLNMNQSQLSYRKRVLTQRLKEGL